MMLEKWAARGLYDYGVSLDLGWITPKGDAVDADMDKVDLFNENIRWTENDNDNQNH